MIEQPFKITCPKCGSGAWNSEEIETNYRCETCGMLIYFNLHEKRERGTK